ncbi:MAG TPA: pitrilysin family protein [Candidatus Polarisedimenticolaceae bacterium]|nr:pitrilysin family protein [Candidatus Polarisedimenticolaceae bacterium]
MTRGTIRKETLPNGITLLSERMPHVRSVTLGIWLKRGSRHEPVSLNGASHFIEHLVFKGTENRTAREIALAVDSIGGQMDAFTSKEYTCFYAKVLDTNLAEAVDLLADIVLRPRFDDDELERERKVIVEEIRMVEDSPEELIYDLFSTHFYPGHALGRPIQGTEDTVRGLSRARLLRFFQTVYVPENLMIVAAGNLEHKGLGRLIKKAFGRMPRGSGKDGKMPPPRARGGVVTRTKKELEQLHLLLGVPAFPEGYERRYPLFVMNALLGGTMSSRLFQKIREERGLAYSVYSAVNAFRDAGILMIYAGTSPEKADEVLDVVRNELRDLRERGPDAHEVEVAKEHLKGSLMLSLESTSSRMSNLARQYLYHGRTFPMGETLARLEKVTLAEVHRAAKDVLRPGAPALAVVGKTKRLAAARTGFAL